MHHITTTVRMGVRAQHPAQKFIGDQQALQLGQVEEGGVAGEHGVHQAVEHERVEREHQTTTAAVTQHTTPNNSFNCTNFNVCKRRFMGFFKVYFF